MTTMEEREAKRALWLKHWQEWSACAEPFAEYARRHELDDDEGYLQAGVTSIVEMWTRFIEIDNCSAGPAP